jgi:crotonobetainyl-CoA:carnitine CoA-transferase CaiB-like acyl-CoA transferase
MADTDTKTRNFDPKLPLAGKKVLEITTAWAGPMLGRILRNFGAEVVKLETLSNVDNWRGAVTGDDPARYPDGDKGEHPWNRSAWFNTQSLGKQSLGIDAKSPAARPAIEAIVKGCDIVISNFAAGALTRLKLDYDHLRALRSDIILLELNVTGEGGPLWDTRGVGPTMEALAGMTPLTGYGDGVPVRTGPAYVDPIGAMNGAMAVLLAVYHHEKTGQGQRIEMAQREALMHLYGEHILLQAEDGKSAAADGNRVAHAAPHDAFRSQGEDDWVAIAVFGDKQWQALCAAMGRADLAADPRFAHAADRVKNADTLHPLVETWTASRDKHAISAELQALGIAAAPVSSGQDIFNDPQLRATGFLYQVDHPEAGRHWYHSLPFHFEGADPSPPPAAPLLGQHTDAILRGWAGLDDAAIAQLHADGVAHQADVPHKEAA